MDHKLNLESKFNKLKKKIQEFSQEQIITNFCKYLWDFEKNIEEGQRKLATVTSWILFISVSNQKHDLSKSLTDTDKEELVELAWEFLDIKERLYNRRFLNSFFQDLNINLQNFSNVCKKYKMKDYLSQSLKPTEEDLQYVCFHSLSEADVRNKNYEIESKYGAFPILRSLLIAEEFKKMFNDNFSFAIENKNNLNLSLQRFHHIFTVIFIIARDHQGVIEVNKLENILQGLSHNASIEEIKILKKDILRLIEALSFDVDSLKNQYQIFENNFMSTLTPLFDYNPFYKKPFYKCNENGIEYLVCSSPYIYSFASAWMFDVLERETQRRFPDETGKAFENYINSFLEFYSKQPNTKFVFKQLSPTSNNTIADFWLETENYIFIIECKKSVSFRTPYNKDMGIPDKVPAVLSRWNRVAEGFIQCFHTKSSPGFPSGKKVFNLIIIGEPVLGEMVTFSLLAYYGEFFKKHGMALGEIGILSISQFEGIIASGALEEFAKACEKAFQEREIQNEEYMQFDTMRKIINLGFEVNSRLLDLSFWENQYHKLDG